MKKIIRLFIVCSVMACLCCEPRYDLISPTNTITDPVSGGAVGPNNVISSPIAPSDQSTQCGYLPGSSAPTFSYVAPGWHPVIFHGAMDPIWQGAGLNNNGVPLSGNNYFLVAEKKSTS